jgi:DNA-binding GntR family transcriptional regulator
MKKIKQTNQKTIWQSNYLLKERIVDGEIKMGQHINENSFNYRWKEGVNRKGKEKIRF